MNDLANIMTPSRQYALQLLDGTTPLPKDFVKPRPGAGNVEYIPHTRGTEVMNNAFGMFWNFFVRSITIDPHDGSATAIVAIVIHVPGHPELDRTVEECGSFQAYPKTTTVQEREEGTNKLTNKTVPCLLWDGSPEYTMPASDRAASAVSRGLMKVLYRGWGFGSELYEDDEYERPQFTNQKAYNMLLAFGKKQGLDKSEIDAVLQQSGATTDNMIDKFQRFWNAINAAAKAKWEEPIPEDLGG